jgi:hypothetical protein
LIFFIKTPKIESMSTAPKPDSTVGKRFDEGKLRVDLVPTQGYKGVAKVFGFGSGKYGDRNWEKCMNWSRMIGSMKRHMLAFEEGEDFDPESGLLHVDHITANAMMLSTYHVICTGKWDDRPKYPKIVEVVKK